MIMEKCSLRGVDVYPFRSADEIIDFADERKGILVAINAEKVMHATEETRRIINANIGYCDGSGPVLALRQKGYGDVCKVAGCDLWLLIVRRFHASKSFYIVGASDEVNRRTVEKLREQFPDLNIVGNRNGYLRSDAEKQALLDDVAAKRPDVVFVAMGSPKQERVCGHTQARRQMVDGQPSGIALPGDSRTQTYQAQNQILAIRLVAHRPQILISPAVKD